MTVHNPHKLTLEHVFQYDLECYLKNKNKTSILEGSSETITL